MIKGLIYTKKTIIAKIYELLIKKFEIEKKYIHLKDDKIEIAPWILEDIAKDLVKKGIECFIVEQYPTADKLEVERIPLTC